MNGPSVDVRLEPGDLRALGALQSGDRATASMHQIYWVLRAVLFVLLVLLSLVHPIVLTAVVVDVALLVLERQARRRAHRSPAYEVLNGRYEVSPRGLIHASPVGETLISWSAVDKVSQSADHLLVRFSGTGWVVPFRCFPSTDECDAFVAAVRSHSDPERPAPLRRP